MTESPLRPIERYGLMLLEQANPGRAFKSVAVSIEPQIDYLYGQYSASVEVQIIGYPERGAKYSYLTVTDVESFVDDAIAWCLAEHHGRQ